MSHADTANIPQAKPGTNVYTALAVVAFVVLVVGVGWLWQSNLELLAQTEHADEAGSNAFYMIPAE